MGPVATPVATPVPKLLRISVITGSPRLVWETPVGSEELLMT